jgi:hypothetical protein
LIVDLLLDKGPAKYILEQGKYEDGKQSESDDQDCTCTASENSSCFDSSSHLSPLSPLCRTKKGANQLTQAGSVLEQNGIRSSDDVQSTQMTR